MKKKGLLCVALLLMGAAWAYVRIAYMNRNNLTPVMLENIEALATGETNISVRCFGYGSIDCPITSAKVRYVERGNF